MGLDPKLLAILVCPKCRGPLRLKQDHSALDCPACRLRFPVERYGEDAWVPDLIVEHAQELGTRDGGS
jgi:uncharacterized protein YbaR (Trm112 family)